MTRLHKAGSGLIVIGALAAALLTWLGILFRNPSWDHFSIQSGAFRIDETSFVADVNGLVAAALAVPFVAGLICLLWPTRRP
jgi:hypothetical protein